MGLIRLNIKIMLLVVMVTNQYVFMINLESLLSHVYVKILFIVDFIRMVKENNYCSRVMKNILIKKL